MFRPKELETTEEPVYDLRDNPDFKYRPGSIVIRVSNFDEPGVSNCGGQVLDNYSSGQIKVWWGDGRTSFVWPQDLYKVGKCQCMQFCSKCKDAPYEIEMTYLPYLSERYEVHSCVGGTHLSKGGSHLESDPLPLYSGVTP